jgi:hypothetical protein
MNKGIIMVVQFLKLDRPVRFWLLVTIAFISIISIHNHYFYVSDEYDSKRDLKKIANIINTSAEICLSNENLTLLSKELTDKCIENINQILVDYRWFGGKGYKVNIDGKYASYEYNDTKYSSEERNPIYLSNFCGKSSRCNFLTTIDSLEANLEISTNPIPSLGLSVYRSLTFSAVELFQSKDKAGFWKYTAWPRSRPAVFILFLLLFTVWLLRLSIIAKIRVIRKMDKSGDFDGE